MSTAKTEPTQKFAVDFARTFRTSLIKGDDVEYHHIPVLLNETIQALKIVPDGVYVDCTLGGGGHARAVAEQLSPGGLFVGIDQDREAIAAAESTLSHFEAPVRLFHANFSDLAAVMRELGVSRANGFLADLGVSSYQLDNPERGFSYRQDAPLDMRMNRETKRSALDIVNNFPEKEITKILAEYGEERWAARIASFIVERRKKEQISSTGDLVEIIKAAIPARARRTGPHPAKRVFQALRIAVNDELSALKNLVNDTVNFAAPGGRICIISYHSLEDRIVKEAFQEHSKGCWCPKDLPRCVCGGTPEIKVITRKPIEPSEEEVLKNPRGRSAKLRVAEKLTEVLNGKGGE